MITKEGIMSMPYAWYETSVGVSQSMLKLLGRSPAHLQEAMTNRRPATHPQEIGQIVHHIVFDKMPPETLYHVRPQVYGGEKKWNANANECKDWLAEHNDKLIVTAHEHEYIQGITTSVLDHPTVRTALMQGMGEQSLFATDPETGMRLKCRPDWLSGEAIPDLKTCEDASRDAFSRSIAVYGYDVQAAFYLDVANLLKLGKKYFLFICVEKTPPYAVAVYQLDNESIEIGRAKYRYWLSIYKECTETGEWPAYDPGVQLISLPEWHKKKQT